MLADGLLPSNVPSIGSGSRQPGLLWGSSRGVQPGFARLSNSIPSWMGERGYELII